MSTIDRVLNSIWQSARRRSWVRVFLLYWSFLTLGPILVGLSVGLTSYFSSLPIISDAAKQAEPLVSMIFPFFLIWLALTLLYIAVPNRKVPFLHAVAGGALGAVFFELSKSLFAFYITLFPNLKIMLGAMTSIPLFLLWIYISWVFVLLGAETVRCLSSFPVRGRSGRSENFAAAVAVLEIFHKHYCQGRPLTMKNLLEKLPGMSEAQAREIFVQFLRTKIIGRLSEGGFVLIVSLNELTLAKFYRMMPWRLSGGKTEGISRELSEIIEHAARDIDKRLSTAMDKLFIHKR